MGNPPIIAESSDPAIPAVLGQNDAAGVGVKGTSQGFQGVYGHSTTNAGVVGESDQFHAVYGVSHDANNAGVIGISTAGGWGVTGRSDRIGVSGETSAGDGVAGQSQSGRGVTGSSGTNAGVYGESQQFVAVYGLSHDPHNAGVMGVNDAGWGVTGRGANTGVSGESVNGVGVHGKGGLLAGFFEGGVKVTGELYVEDNIRLPSGSDIQLEGADCAEHFAMADPQSAEPGAVMVIGADGALQPCGRAYDKRVAGVVSGAGRFRPGIVLDQGQACVSPRPIALVGKVYCLVDADHAPVEAGDLLTTSQTPGHAMKAADPARAFGAVLGKALGALPGGRALVPILVCLQ